MKRSLVLEKLCWKEATRSWNRTRKKQTLARGRKTKMDLEDKLTTLWQMMEVPVMIAALRRGYTTKINGEICLVIKGFGDIPRGNCLYATNDGQFYVKHDQDGSYNDKEGFTDVKKLETFTNFANAMNYAWSNAGFKD
jgi:hypothetical protein